MYSFDKHNFRDLLSLFGDFRTPPSCDPYCEPFQVGIKERDQNLKNEVGIKNLKKNNPDEST